MRRSMLFLPGNNPNMLINGNCLGADAIIFDLEEIVAAISMFYLCRGDMFAREELLAVAINGGAVIYNSELVAYCRKFTTRTSNYITLAVNDKVLFVILDREHILSIIKTTNIV